MLLTMARGSWCVCVGGGKCQLGGTASHKIRNLYSPYAHLDGERERAANKRGERQRDIGAAAVGAVEHARKPHRGGHGQPHDDGEIPLSSSGTPVGRGAGEELHGAEVGRAEG